MVVMSRPTPRLEAAVGGRSPQSYRSFTPRLKYVNLEILGVHLWSPKCDDFNEVGFEHGAVTWRCRLTYVFPGPLKDGFLTRVHISDLKEASNDVTYKSGLKRFSLGSLDVAPGEDAYFWRRKRVERRHLWKFLNDERIRILREKGGSHSAFFAEFFAKNGFYSIFHSFFYDLFTFRGSLKKKTTFSGGGTAKLMKNEGF